MKMRQSVWVDILHQFQQRQITDGNTATYRKWASGQPNNANGQCVAQRGTNTNGEQWNDIRCTRNRRGIYKLPASRLCEAITKSYSCYEADSTGCSENNDCKGQALSCCNQPS
eukprot:scaffold67457_cov90-Attheya_sp.AAC.6